MSYAHSCQDKNIYLGVTTSLLWFEPLIINQQSLIPSRLVIPYMYRMPINLATRNYTWGYVVQLPYSHEVGRRGGGGGVGGGAGRVQKNRNRNLSGRETSSEPTSSPPTHPPQPRFLTRSLEFPIYAPTSEALIPNPENVKKVSNNNELPLAEKETPHTPTHPPTHTHTYTHHNEMICSRA